jgi:hypothetical protein
LNELVRRDEITAAVFDYVFVLEMRNVMPALKVGVQDLLEAFQRVCFGGAKLLAFAAADHLVPNGHHGSLASAA